MQFLNLKSELTLNDKLDLLSVQVEFKFPTNNTEAQKLFLQHFPGLKTFTKMDDNHNSFIQAKVPLTDAGKLSLKNLISDLKKLDEEFGNRTALVDDFSKLFED